MCFSAGASFTAGVILLTAGIATVKKAKVSSQLAFAAIPLIFAVQQFTEGLLWISLLNPEYAIWQQPVTYLFLIFAQVVWPTWVPVSILLLEKKKKRKSILYIISGLGILTSFYLSSRMIMHDVRAEVIGHHIHYNLWVPVSVLKFFGIIYFITTVVSHFISGIKKIWWLGFLTLLSFLTTKIFFEFYLISVWCFFAAIISTFIYVIVKDINKMPRPFQ